VPFALCGDPDASPPRLLLDAAAAVAEGLPELVALEAITRRPAEILGVDDEVGSLLPGRRADLVVLSGEPFATTTSVVRVFVGGEESLASRSDAVVVKAGTVLTGDGTRLDGGAVLIEDGKIVAVGRTVPRPPGCRVIDGGEESYLTPGLIDAHGHLGLEGDRSAPPTDIALWQTVGVAREDFVRVARSGVTTVLLAPYSASPRGSQVAAIKTWGMDRDDLVLRGLAGVFFSPRENDPLLDARALEGALKAGKAYHDQWVKYEEALKKWEEEQKKKKEEETRKKAEAANGKDAAKPDAPEKKAPEEKPDDKKEEKPVEEVKKVADPLSGRWDVTLSGGPLPEPQKGTMHLKLEGNLVNGKMTSPFGDEVMVTGTLNGTRVVLEIDMETPFGAPRLEAEIDREDHMTGKLAVGPLNLDFEGTRVEKDIGEIKVTRKKKQEGEDGKPVAPDRKEDLEPFRALLTGKIPALVAATRAPWLLAYAKLFAEYKASLVFLGATAADEVQSTLAEQKIGVVLPTQEEIRRGRKLTPIGDLYARAGLEVAFQSDAEDGARALRAGAIMAVHRGMDASAALTALTAAPARLFKIDDRVGMLEKGRDGDLVLFSGPPLESGSRILAVLVNGKEVIEP
jgi:imidazolonepropionase-like amidohydrolase